MASNHLSSPRPMNDRGQGRKPGGVNEKTKLLRNIAAKALAEGVTPAEVMLDNMRFFHEKVDVLQTAILQKVTAKGVLKGEDAMKMLTEFKELGEFRMKAQKCAVDAAPYFHPTLSAVKVEGEVTHRHEDAEAAFKIIEASLNEDVTGETIMPERKKSKVPA